jgi:hypothetical protein
VVVPPVVPDVVVVCAIAPVTKAIANAINVFFIFLSLLLLFLVKMVFTIDIYQEKC